MQLTKQEISSIKTLFHEFFSDKDQLWLFGACVNPGHKDGVVDLYIETQETDYDAILRQKKEYIDALANELGQKKVDIFVKITQDDVADLPIYTVARDTGMQLI
jgi:transcription antitermination factor NusA-like protein